MTYAQTDDPVNEFASEEYGISATLPLGWETWTAGDNWDIAFVSPEASTQDVGSFMTLKIIPSLGADTTFESLLQPLTEGTDLQVESATIAGLEGSQVTKEDTENSVIERHILLPYGNEGGALYIYVDVLSDQQDLTNGVLDSLTINPPVADVAAIDAAWQTSLVDQGTLVYGDPDAPVTMVEIFDFSCGHCATFTSDVARLMALDVTAGTLKIELQAVDRIGGEMSNRAAEAMYCAAEQGKGYTAYHALFNSYVESGDPNTAYSEDGIATTLSQPDLGIDMDTLNACLEADTGVEVINRNLDYWNTVGATGTPTLLFAAGNDEPQFLIGPDGTEVRGALALSALRGVIQQIASGTPITELFSGAASEEATAESSSPLVVNSSKNDSSSLPQIVIGVGMVMATVVVGAVLVKRQKKEIPPTDSAE
jgi:protein-disulfide isomerase